MRHTITIFITSLCTSESVQNLLREAGGKFIEVEPHLTDNRIYHISCDSVAFLCWISNILGKFGYMFTVSDHKELETLNK